METNLIINQLNAELYYDGLASLDSPVTIQKMNGWILKTHN